MLSLSENRGGFHPLAVLEVPDHLCHFAKIEFGVEVGREGLFVGARVRIHDVDKADRVEIMLQRVGAIGVGDARIETGAEHGQNARFLVALLERPLLPVLEMRLVLELIVGRVDVGHLRRQARLHDRKVLVGKRNVDNHLRRHLFNKSGHLTCLIGVHNVCGNIHARALKDRSRHRIGLRDRAACQVIFLKISLFMAHLCAVTLPTPPAPIISTVPSAIEAYPSVCCESAQ